MQLTKINDRLVKLLCSSHGLNERLRVPRTVVLMMRGIKRQCTAVKLLSAHWSTPHGVQPVPADISTAVLSPHLPGTCGGHLAPGQGTGHPA